MNEKRRHLIISLSLITVTVGFIWINSAVPGSDSGALSDRVREFLTNLLNVLHFPEGIKLFLLEHVRKVAHAVEYAAIGAELGFLWAGLEKGLQGLWNAWSTVLAVAVFDETIQLFATSRGPQIQDVLLDAASGTAAILFVYLAFIITRRIISRKPPRRKS